MYRMFRETSKFCLYDKSQRYSGVVANNLRTRSRHVITEREKTSIPCGKKRSFRVCEFNKIVRSH